MPTPDSFQNGNVVVLSALACGGVALAIAAGLWALAEQRAARRLRRSLRTGRRQDQGGGGRARCAAGRRAARRWWCGAATAPGPSPMAAATSCCSPASRAPTRWRLSSALDGLSDRGAGFPLTVHDAHGRQLVARGRAVGGMAAVWLEEPNMRGRRTGADFRAILDALPIPVWLRDKGLALTWGNHAFLQGAGAKDLETRAARASWRWTRPNAIWPPAPAAAECHAGSQALRGGGRPAPRLAFTEIPAGRCRHHRHRGRCDRRRGGRSPAAAACRRPCRHAGQACDGGGDFRPRPEADLLQPRLCRSCGACRKPGSTGIPATAKSSTGCARRANCRSSATIRPGSASAWRSIRRRARESSEEHLASARRPDHAGGGPAASLRRPDLPL